MVTTESIIAPEARQQPPDQDCTVTQVVMPVYEDALPQGQLQHILGPYSQELFDDYPEEQPAIEPAAETEKAEVALRPGKFLPPCLLLIFK